jgi:hypothetical protein
MNAFMLVRAEYGPCMKIGNLERTIPKLIRSVVPSASEVRRFVVFSFGDVIK